MAPIIVSFSELDTARQCLFKHKLGYKERWKPAEVGEALNRGTLWHHVLESHYRQIWELQKSGEVGYKLLIPGKVKREWLQDRSGGQSEMQELVEWMYDGHIEHYGYDEQWKILAVEHAPTIPLPNESGNRSRFRLKLKIDLVVSEAGKIWIIDHKSCKDLPKDKELDIDDQFGLYTAAMRRLGKKVFGSVHSAARTHRNKDQAKHPQPLEERFRRGMLYRTDIELDNLLTDAFRWARLAYSFKGGEPRSPDPDRCRWRCDFTEPCLASRKGMDLHNLLVSMGFEQDFTRH